MCRSSPIFALLLMASATAVGCDYEPPPESALPYGDTSSDVEVGPGGGDGDSADSAAADTTGDTEPPPDTTPPPDRDDDGVVDSEDNCPGDANADQSNLDGDDLGDVCDPDTDGDGTHDEEDCAPRNPDRHPEAEETCGPVDTDCDGLPFDVEAQTQTGSGVDLTAYWPFDAYDEGAFPNMATGEPGDLRARPDAPDNAPATASGAVGEAVEFDGSHFLKIDHDSVFELPEGTVMFWFRPDASAGDAGLFTKDASGFLGGGHLSMVVRESGSEEHRLVVRSQSDEDEEFLDGGEFSTDGWHHVALTFGGEGLQLYLDGDQRDTQADRTYGLWSDDGSIENRQPVTVGANGQASDDGAFDQIDGFFEGRIDELAVFDAPIDPAGYYQRCAPSR